MAIYRHKWLIKWHQNWKWVVSKVSLVVIEHNSYFLLHSYNQVSLGVQAPIQHLSTVYSVGKYGHLSSQKVFLG